MAGVPRFNAIRPSCLHLTPTNRYHSRFVTAKNSNAGFSTTSRLQSYEDTLKNLKIGADTKVLFQGFTGTHTYLFLYKEIYPKPNKKMATANVKESLQWGTKIVGGVKPGVEGEHLGLPVFPSVRVAQEKARPDATAVYVPGNQTAAAIEEAIEAEIPLVVAVAEHVPIHDILRIHSILRTQSKTRLVGANCPGIISAIGKCRIGFQPLPCFSSGHVGIVAKSGTLSYETVASTTRAGLGQSLCIGMGGDVLAGTDFVDALKVFEHDDDTHGIIIVGEIGGTAEMDAAEWIKDYRRRTANPKPIMGLVGGIEAPHGRIMGHAGAWTAPGEPDAQMKIKALQDAGAVIVDHPEKFGEGMKTLLGNSAKRPVFEDFTPRIARQQRGVHTLRRPQILRSSSISAQRRSLYLQQSDSFVLLKERNIPVRESNEPGAFFLGASIDRTAHSPSFIASPTIDAKRYIESAKIFPFEYGKREFSANSAEIQAIAAHVGLAEPVQKSLSTLLEALTDIFMTKEAFSLETKVAVSSAGVLEVQGARFGFDDAAYRSAKRQEDIHKLRNKELEVPEEVEAEKDGIVYVRLEGEGTIGTLVNGAGLAMNTVDALTIRGGHCANFLDTGGKATSETVKSAFKIILSDPRVKAIFVNIFGGLTRSEMIAEGIIMAFRDLGMKVPVVVRLRGTNEELGQKMIAESKLPLHAFDSFKEAAAKVISLSHS
ncbi:succinyl-CoA synthetase beta chain, putative [Coccidioides posadasii C735 delta SOWgp]|uniref:Succinyl-CoA synthetase beta chain, putative n=1 Tax=Coccidioides posadasii (strain C735) TaxID=222929 RepID=C5P5I2_COCP7|nr:succinyl-CoA synthetase beta chain, putative [Coccidioides posadasii C735 delta SOWgp]EER27972.1 succinyl-CoA synthetase beta chain, putative [Coccidioides posadasii C735 delta SOWgp]|eukprot:XP_003070117.1 succinyl-CoA synthetase beta chain, putative [Coccidioides posadasii C735 delta SOWgp]